MCPFNFVFLLSLLSLVNLGDVGDEVNNLVAVTPLVVIPADEFHEVAVKSDAGLGVEDRSSGVGDEIGGNNLVLGVPSIPFM